jgi:hypothetical protein
VITAICRIIFCIKAETPFPKYSLQASNIHCNVFGLKNICIYMYIDIEIQ